MVFIFFYYHLYYNLIVIIPLDIHMRSPPHIPAEGSSRSSGGVLRGRAFGNHPNMADYEDDSYLSPDDISQHHHKSPNPSFSPHDHERQLSASQHHHNQEPQDQPAVSQLHTHQKPLDPPAIIRSHSRHHVHTTPAVISQQQPPQDQPNAVQSSYRQDNRGQAAVPGVIYMLDSDKSPGDIDINYDKRFQIKVPDIAKFSSYQSVIHRTMRDYSPPRCKLLTTS